MNFRLVTATWALALAGSGLAASPALGETPAQLDALARATQQPGPGLALAREQINAGELLDALGTLERVILNDPDNNEARLLHAATLCRMDDRRGAIVELDPLRNRDIPETVWREETAPCSGRREG